MIGQLSVPAFLLLCAASFAFLGLVVYQIHRHTQPPQVSPEVEQDGTREVAAHGAHWNGTVTLAEFDAEIPFALDSVEDKDDWLRRNLHKHDAA